MENFEGGDPRDLTDVKILHHGPFHVAPKLDGIRYILYKRKKECYVVTRRGERHMFPLMYHKNTQLPNTSCETYTLDIEKVDKKYYILDVLQLDSLNLRDKSFQYRYDLLRMVIHPSDSFMIAPYLKWHSQIYFPDIVKNFPVDGIIFVPSELNYHAMKLRWKYVNTIDFQALANDFLGILVGKDQIIPFKIGKYEQQSAIPLKKGLIYECRFDMIQNKWFPICRRDDKIKPNRLNIARFIFYNVIVKQHSIQPFSIE